MLLLQLFVNGIQVGILYALTAVGFSLIFGSTKIFHFAHGATFVIAAYIFQFFYGALGLHWIVGVIAAVMATVTFGLFLNRFVYVPIQRHEGSYFTIFVASFGSVIIVQNLTGIIFGRGFLVIDTPLSRGVEVIDNLLVSPLLAIALLCAVVIFGGLHLVMTRSHIGIALRALSESPELVRTFGLSARRLSMYAFALGSSLVVPAAIFTGATSGLNPAIGYHVMLISLISTIVGGVGSIWGAAIVGLMIGIAENVALWQVGSQWSEAVSFAILFLFIIFRPSGLFGRASVH